MKYRAKPVILLQSLKDNRNLGITQIDRIGQGGHMNNMVIRRGPTAQPN